MKKLFFLSLLSIFSIAVFAQAEGKSANKSKNKKQVVIIEEDTLPKVPVIKFKSLVHDYGNIYKNDNGICTFEFTNTGKANLQLTNVSSSCGCTVPDWPKDPIPPGQSAAIKVSYDTKRVGGINRSIHVDSNTGERVTLSIRGNVAELPAEIIPENKTSPLMNNNQ